MHAPQSHAHRHLARSAVLHRKLWRYYVMNYIHQYWTSLFRTCACLTRSANRWRFSIPLSVFLHLQKFLLVASHDGHRTWNHVTVDGKTNTVEVEVPTFGQFQQSIIIYDFAEVGVSCEHVNKRSKMAVDYLHNFHSTGELAFSEWSFVRSCMEIYGGYWIRLSMFLQKHNWRSQVVYDLSRQS